MNADLSALQSALGHVFTRPALLEEALTHPSYLNEIPDAGPHNQRLEFLGDAVLQLILTAELHARYPAEQEGPLSRRRAVLANGRQLAAIARGLGLHSALRLGGSENTPEGRSRPSNLEDAMEAIIGAIYLDAGFDAARSRVLAYYGDLEKRFSADLGSINPKGQLQERFQPVYGNNALRYETVQSGGADHAKEYTSRIYLADAFLAQGTGSSKKAAEEEAARAALASLPPPPLTR